MHDSYQTSKLWLSKSNSTKINEKYWTVNKDTADYQCKIENAYSQKTSSAQVLVLGKNNIIIHHIITSWWRHATVLGLSPQKDWDKFDRKFEIECVETVAV